MHNLGYIALDAEVGGPGFFRGLHSILEIALLPFPNPTQINLPTDRFVEQYINPSKVHYFVIQPYAEVKQEILEAVVKKPLAFYQTNGRPVKEVSDDIIKILSGLKTEYRQIFPAADWHGDVDALNYITSLNGQYVQELIGQHNMLHIKSFAKGKMGSTQGGFDAQKVQLLRQEGERNVQLVRNHRADQDVLEIAEVLVRALRHTRNGRKAPQQKQKLTG